MLERALAGAAVALVAALALGATGARAGDFEDAFEHELGRLAAQNVVAFGHFIFAGPHYAHPRKRYEPYWQRGYDYGAHQHPRPHPHWVHVHHHVHRGRPCKIEVAHYHGRNGVVYLHGPQHHRDIRHAHCKRAHRHGPRQIAYRY